MPEEKGIWIIQETDSGKSFSDWQADDEDSIKNNQNGFVSASQLRENVAKFLKVMKEAFDQAENTQKEISLSELECSIVINAKGQIGLFGIGGEKAGAKRGAIKLKFTKQVSSTVDNNNSLSDRDAKSNHTGDLPNSNPNAKLNQTRDLPNSEAKIKLKTQSFQTITVNRRGEIIKKETKSAKYFSEDLGNGVTLDLVYIPPGKFMMGTDDREIKGLLKKFYWEYFRPERPQHEVIIQNFFMGKFLVTQAQWKAIASRQDLKINRDLQINPSRFKGDDNLPVEQVSWYDALEYCARLRKLTGKNYRLPSESQWEYACRANTQTPFCFGETITSKLVNYSPHYIFAEELEGKYVGKTTIVGRFPPNGFGLYDMHGNLWEWCEDDWHKNYENAPDDDKPWVDKNERVKVSRGGSWASSPNDCRSAFRLNFIGEVAVSGNNGFRVVCG